MVQLEEYIPIVGQSTVDELRMLARHLEGKQVQNINSTAVGGGVAEILSRMIPLLNQLGVQARWDVIKGDEKFFVITKKFHNGLHGVPVTVSDDEYEWFLQVNRDNAQVLQSAGLVFVHDPQPVALIDQDKHEGRKWMWRCHIDFSRPDRKIWSFLEQYIKRYDVAVFSAPAFARSLPIPQVLIAPSIDPLSDKNKELPESYIDSVFERFHIDRSLPVVTRQRPAAKDAGAGGREIPVADAVQVESPQSFHRIDAVNREIRVARDPERHLHRRRGGDHTGQGPRARHVQL